MNRTRLYSPAAEHHHTLAAEGRIGPSGWSQTSRWVTHPSIYRFRHRVTSLIKTNAIPLSQAATLKTVYVYHLYPKVAKQVEVEIKGGTGKLWFMWKVVKVEVGMFAEDVYEYFYKLLFETLVTLQVFKTHTHTTILWPFSRTTWVSRCQKKSSSGLHGAIEDIRGKYTNNPAGRQYIQTNQRPTSFPPSLSWIGTGTKYGGLHTEVVCIPKCLKQ